MRCGWLLLAILSVLVTGCGGNGEDETPAKTAQPAVTARDIRETGRDHLRDGGTLTWPIDLYPPNFNFNQIDGTEQNHYWLNRAVMPVMYRSDASGTPHWNPDFLASEPTLSTEPAQVVTYTIHPKAVWSDGSPITWQDFYWQWKALNGSDKAYQIAASNGYADIARVERGRDDREVVVTYAHHYADWQKLFTPLYPASTNKAPQVFNEGWKNRLLVTSGPFRLERIDLTSRTITLVRNEKWWGPTPKLDRIVFRVMDPDAQIDALANGEIDGMDIGADANKFNRARTVEAAEIRAAAGPNYRHVTFNGSSPILQDVNVRRALAKAIDHERSPVPCSVPSASSRACSTTTSSWRTRAGTWTTPAMSAATIPPRPARSSIRPAGCCRMGYGGRTAGHSRCRASSRAVSRPRSRNAS